ncbi:MAG: dihydrolipoamide acetyltransferase family protein [Bacteroidia bacterium]
MSDSVDLIMPKMGESIAEATILKWLKKEGDDIKIDEPVLEIATDKVDSEVPSPVEGKLGKILFQEGDVVAVGDSVAKIITAGGGADSSAPAREEAETEPARAESGSGKESRTASALTSGETKGELKSRTEGGKFYSPLVLNIARREGITSGELEAMEGSGREGRVTKKDILAYVSNGRKAQEKQEQPAQSAAPAGQPSDKITVQEKPQAGIKEMDVPLYPGDEIIEMDRMRKLISAHMVHSKHTSAHVTSMVEVDVTNLVKWRDRIKKDFEKREGEKITFTPIFIEALAKAIRDFPMINISVAGDKIIKRKAINIGMAAALPSGNLIVPVIRNADEKNLLGLTKAVNDLAKRARENKLKPEEIQGGTFTLTNVGTFGNVMGTPVINQPQVAIMAAGAIKKKPAVLETEDGDVIAIRHMMFLSHAYDHRVVDGMLGGSFVRRVADYLEAWDVNRTL